MPKSKKEDESLRQKATDWIAPYEKATSDFFGNPLEKIEKNFKPNKKTGKGILDKLRDRSPLRK